MVEIRKNKREENLQKKRREGFSAAAQTGLDLPSAKKVCVRTDLINQIASVSIEDGILGLIYLIWTRLELFFGDVSVYRDY